MKSLLDKTLEDWLDNALSTSSQGWSPIDGYKGKEEDSEKEALKDYRKYLSEAKQEIKSLFMEMLPEKKKRPISGPNRNGNSEGVRKAYNRAIEDTRKKINEL
jgi:hypothetical protein